MMIRIPKPGFISRQMSAGNRVRNVTWNPKEINGVLNQYDFDSCKIHKALNGGNSDNIFLQTSCGKKVLNRYIWSLQSTLHEHSVIRHSNAHNFTCVQLVPNKNSLSYTEFGNRHYAIYNFIEGYCCSDYLLRPKSRQRLIALAGQKLADFHRMMTGFVLQGKKLNGLMPDGKRLWRDTAWHFEVLDTYLKKAGEKTSQSKPEAYLQDIAEELKKAFIETDRYYQKPDPQLPRLVIHGDYQPRNVLFDQNGICGILDFGDANLNLRIADVVRGLSTFCKDKNHLINAVYAKIFLQAYQDREGLYEKEITAIPDLMLNRNLRNIIWSLHREINNFQNQRPPNYRFMKMRLQWEEALRIQQCSADLQKRLLSFWAG